MFTHHYQHCFRYSTQKKQEVLVLWQMVHWLQTSQMFLPTGPIISFACFVILSILTIHGICLSCYRHWSQVLCREWFHLGFSNSCERGGWSHLPSEKWQCSGSWPLNSQPFEALWSLGKKMACLLESSAWLWCQPCQNGLTILDTQCFERWSEVIETWIYRQSHLLW